MIRPNPPRVVGVGGGVGTTTLATALRGRDRGRAPDQGVDVLVCRATGDSLHAAAGAVAWLASAGRPRPALAVTSDSPIPVRGMLRARLHQMHPWFVGLVVLPYVTTWRELADPLPSVARLAAYPVQELPRQLKAYATALERLTEVLLSSGLLHPGPRALSAAVTAPALAARGPGDEGARRPFQEARGGRSQIQDSGPGAVEGYPSDVWDRAAH
ncbi:MAG TPA: hypothetical protein VFE65_22220 [Pseudonocardia sp.]|jgi:hypothetical protein|nr:hypothetical protein [Pseudonocardia sp.]